MISLEKFTANFDARQIVPAGRAHIAAIDPDVVVAANALYNSEPVAVSDLIWKWQYVGNQSMRYQLNFVRAGGGEGNAQTLRIALVNDVVGLETPITPWTCYHGAMRAAAWTAAHEALIDLLCVLCGVDWILSSVDLDCSSTAPTADQCAIGFSIECEYKHTKITDGIVYLSQDLCKTLLTRSQLGTENPLWQRCGTYVRCVVDTVDIDVSELSSLECDSIVLIDNQTLTSIQPRVLLTVGEQRWVAEVRDTKLSILARSDRSVDKPSTTYEGLNMETELDNDSTHVAEAEPVDIVSVPITLRFEAGQLALPFERLQSIRPGFVFELDRPLDQQAITIYANDKLVASGELVLVGSRIGVRLTNGCPPVAVPIATPVTA